MKITCPQCGAAGNLPDHEIPEEGRFLSCPRCKHGFDVKKPRMTNSEYMIDTCPACAYSTFGEERFSACPKCGVNIKAYIDRQREEKARAREQELLTRKFSRDTAPPPSVPGGAGMAPASTSSPQPEAKGVDLGEMIENLHPVNLIGWGSVAVGVVIAIIGIVDLIEFLGTDYAAKLNEQFEALGLPERASAIKIFFQHGLIPWVELLYGVILATIAAMFLKHKAVSRQWLIWATWGMMAYVPVRYLVILIGHFFEPSRPSFGTFAVEFFTMLVVGALVGVPLFMLCQYLDHKQVKSIVKLP